MIDREEIKKRRLLRQLTLEEAALRAGFSTRQRWYAVEAGQRRNIAPDTLFAIARTLGCHMDDLMKPEDPTAKKRK